MCLCSLVNTISSESKLRDITKEFRNDYIRIIKIKNLECEVRIQYLPFTNQDKKIQLKDNSFKSLMSPFYGFEIKVLNIEESIYRSHWIMSGDIIWYFNQKFDISIDHFIETIIKELKFEERILNYLKQKNFSQLSLF